MAKYYAVRKGLKTGIFDNWDEVKNLVNGFAGAEYKSFSNKSDAEDYLKGIAPVSNTELTSFETKCAMVAYTDGSYNDKTHRSGYGVVIVNPKGKIIDTIQGSIPAKSRQVDGELFAVLTAIMYAIKKGVKSIEIRYDYEGVGKWANGNWTAAEECSIEYKRALKSLKAFIDVRFQKVPAHSGVALNNEADKLAKSGCGM